MTRQAALAALLAEPLHVLELPDPDGPGGQLGTVEPGRRRELVGWYLAIARNTSLVDRPKGPPVTLAQAMPDRYPAIVARLQQEYRHMEGQS